MISFSIGLCGMLMGLIVVLLPSAGSENLAQELYVMWQCELPFLSDHKHTTQSCVASTAKLAAIKMEILHKQQFSCVSQYVTFWDCDFVTHQIHLDLLY